VTSRPRRVSGVTFHAPAVEPITLLISGPVERCRAQAPHVRETSKRGSRKIAKLLIEVPYHRLQGRQCRWADRKTWKVQDHLGAVLQELAIRAVEDAQHLLDEKGRGGTAPSLWEQAMAEAQRKAHEERDARPCVTR
jgi:hypothetical protein